MKGYLFIDNDRLGEVDFKIIDESMGGIGGVLTPYDSYSKYQTTIQEHCNKKGISNVSNFNFRIVLSDNSKLKPEGGIGITDMKGVDEIYVESAGNDWEIIEKIRRNGE